MNIQEALTREVGETIVKISGLVTRAGKRTESDHAEYGHTSFQPITIKDSTGEIGVTLGGQLEIKQGVSIVIEAHKSEKHGFTGIKIEEYKDKKQLKVSKSAVLTVEGTDMSSKTENHVKQPIPIQNQPLQDVPPDWNGINLRKDRQISLSYAKDLAVVGKISVDEILNLTERFLRYIYKGIPDNTMEQDEYVKSEANSDTIPF